MWIKWLFVVFSVHVILNPLVYAAAAATNYGVFHPIIFRLPYDKSAWGLQNPPSRVREWTPVGSDSQSDIESVMPRSARLDPTLNWTHWTSTESLTDWMKCGVSWHDWAMTAEGRERFSRWLHNVNDEALMGSSCTNMLSCIISKTNVNNVF